MPQKHMSLYEHWRMLAELDPGKRILGERARWLTAQETLSLSEHLAGQLLSLGICQGDYVALRAEQSIASILALIALRTIGAIVVLTDSPVSPGECMAVASAEIPIRASVEPSSEWFFSVVTDTEDSRFHLLSLPPVHFTPSPVEPDAPAFLALSAELAEGRRAIVLSEERVIGKLLHAAPPDLCRVDDVALGTQPMEQTDWLGLICGVAVFGYALYLPQMTELSALPSVIEKEHITRIDGCFPLFHALCRQKDSRDLSSLRVGFLSGDAVSNEQTRSVENALGITLIPVYNE